MTKHRVLFLCTGNSARSQMAEALLRELGGEHFEVQSAGTQPVGLNPLAIEVMGEIGIDIAAQRSKSLQGFLGQPFDYVITVCDRAKESCPVFPGARETAHWSFDDPVEAPGGDVERKVAFRRVRDEIRHRLRLFLATLERR